MIKLPTFLIVGAAKSGTTTINYYLDNHAEVFMSDPKEPKFFSFKYSKYTGIGDDLFTKKRSIKTIQNYENLFLNVESQKCIGEASVDNLFYHELVIPEIKEILSEPKIIILLRHPVDRAISAYSHLIRDGRESLSFEQALLQEESRLKKGYEFIWGYKKGGMYYNQVKNYLNNFSQVEVIFFDELIQSPQKTLDKITSFLEIAPVIAKNTLKLNISGRSKNKIVNILISRDTKLRRLLTAFVGKKRAIRIKSFVQRKNVERISISLNSKEELNRMFKEDLSKLQELLNKDLSHWINKY